MKPTGESVDAACHREDLPSCFQSDIASLNEKLEHPWQWFPILLSTSKDVEEKVLTQSNTSLYKCMECPCTFGTLHGLKIHNTTTHVTKAGSTAEQYECAECGVHLSRYSELENHLKSNLVQNCGKCPYGTRSAHLLKKHLDGIHTRKKPNILRNRRKTTTENSNLKQPIVN